MRSRHHSNREEMRADLGACCTSHCVALRRIAFLVAHIAGLGGLMGSRGRASDEGGDAAT